MLLFQTQTSPPHPFPTPRIINSLLPNSQCICIMTSCICSPLLIPGTHYLTLCYLVFKWLWSSFFLFRNSCLPSIQTYWKPGASSDLRWPRLPQSLAWVNVVYLWLHTTSLQSVPKILVTVKQSTPLVLSEPLVGGSSFAFVKDEALASVCRLLWSLLSFQLPFFSSASLLQRVHKGCSCHLNLAGMFLPGGWLTFSPGVLKWKSFLTILYLELNPFLPCSSGMFYFSPGNLTLSMTMCVFSSYFLYKLIHAH